MKYPFPLYDLPEGFVLCSDYLQLCKLKAYKRKRIPSNLTPCIGKVLFLYSEIHDQYYKRILQPYHSREYIENYIKRKILYYKPDHGTRPQISDARRRSDFSGITSKD